MAIDEYFNHKYDSNCSSEYRALIDRYTKIYNALVSMSDSDFQSFWSNYNLQDKSRENILKIETALISNR
jgi:hypothetical protein